MSCAWPRRLPRRCAGLTTQSLEMRSLASADMPEGYFILPSTILLQKVNMGKFSRNLSVVLTVRRFSLDSDPRMVVDQQGIRR